MADVDPERFAVVVVPNPPAACPGDTVDFVVVVENLTTSPQFFRPHYGLLLTNGPRRHIVAGFSTTVDAGETVSVVATATVSDLRGCRECLTSAIVRLRVTASAGRTLSRGR